MSRPAPTISVLITYHEEGELLTQCLNTLFNQKSRPAEVYVYDDASKIKKAKNYIPVGFPVKLVEGLVNRGPAFARNELAKAAKSDYIHFQDSDDFFNEGWHEKVIEKLCEDDYDVVFTELESYRDGKLACAKVMEIQGVSTNEELLKFSVQQILTTPAGTYRKSLFFNLGGYETKYPQSEDYHFHVRLAYGSPKFALINQSLIRLNLRTHSHSQSRINNAKYTYLVLGELAELLPHSLYPSLGYRAAISASEMFVRGEVEIARIGFRLAKTLGCTYFHRNFFYRVIALSLGQEAAEIVAELYRRARKRQITHAPFDEGRPTTAVRIKKAS